MASVLGLDLGTRSVKAVRVDGAGRTWTVGAFHEFARPAELEPEASLAAALAELASSGATSGVDQVVVALPGEQLATHALTLPFTDVKKLEAALPFEVEAHLPFELSEAVFDYQPSGQRELAPGSREKRTDLLVGVARREAVAELLAKLEAAGVEPRVLTHPGLSLQSLLAVSPALFQAAGDAPAAVVDVGAAQTTVAVGMAGGTVEFARSFTFGGRDLTRALAQGLGLSPDEAEQLKCTQARLGQGVTEEESRVGELLARALQPLVRELRATLKAAASRTRTAPSAVFLCGGTAGLPGLAPFLAEALGVAVLPLGLPPEAAGKVGPERAGEASQALALALRGQLTGARAPRFNLRRGEFSPSSANDWLRERVGRLTAYAAVLVALYLGSGFLEVRMLAEREKALDKVLCDVTQKALGKCEPDYNRALSMMRGKESPAATLPRHSAATLLAELTSRIPAGVPVTFDQVVLDLDRISVRGETESSRQIDELTAAIKGFHCFKEIKEGKVEKSKDGQKVAFRLDIQVECPEDGASPQG
jgi:general secretion pathway protein L